MPRIARGVLLRLVGGLRDLDAAGLAAAAGLDLRLDDGHAAARGADPLGGRTGLLGGRGDGARRARARRASRTCHGPGTRRDPRGDPSSLSVGWMGKWSVGEPNGAGGVGAPRVARGGRWDPSHARAVAPRDDRWWDGRMPTTTTPRMPAAPPWRSPLAPGPGACGDCVVLGAEPEPAPRPARARNPAPRHPTALRRVGGVAGFQDGLAVAPDGAVTGTTRTAPVDCTVAARRCRPWRPHPPPTTGLNAGDDRIAASVAARRHDDRPRRGRRAATRCRHGRPRGARRRARCREAQRTSCRWGGRWRVPEDLSWRRSGCPRAPRWR